MYYGWWNVVAGFIGMGLSYPMFTVFAFGTFVKPLENEFGWQRGEISFAITVTNIAIIIVSPVLGILIDRVGVRRVLIPSVLLMGLTVAGMSLLTGNIWHFYAMYLLIPLLGAGTLPQSYSRTIIGWFARRRGLALGITLAGFGVGTMLVPIVAQLAIENFGWRTAYLIFAAAVLCISLPTAFFLIKESPRVQGAAIKGMEAEGLAASSDSAAMTQTGLSVREAANTRNFWLIVGSFLLVGITLPSIIAHLVPMLIDRGVSPRIAALCMSTFGFGLIVGRVLAGFLMDHFFAPYVTAAFLVGPIVGMMILATGTVSGIIFAAAILIGMAMGSEISEIAYIVSRYFGPRSFGRIYGLMFAVFQFGSAFGPPLVGIYFERSGNYLGALWVLAAVVLLAAALIALVGPYPTLEDNGSAGRQS